MTTVIAFGNSHLLAPHRYFASAEARDELGFDLKSFLMLPGYYEPAWKLDGHQIVWSETLTRDLTAALRTPDCRCVLTSVFGNVWAPRSLLDSAIRYDFFLEDDAEPSDNLPRQVIPLALMRALARQDLSGSLLWIDYLRSLTDKPIIEMIPPPPVDFGPDRFTRTHHFAAEADENIRKFGVCPGNLRRKLWKLYMRMTSTICAELGISVIAPPDETMDANGSLLESLCSGDSVHANQEYGKIMLQQIGRGLRDDRTQRGG